MTPRVLLLYTSAVKKILSSVAFIAVFTLYAVARAVGLIPVPPLSEAPRIITRTTDSIPDVWYRDGTYKGKTVVTWFGNIQVQVIVVDGKVTDVELVEFPTGNRTTEYINDLAIPPLQSEAIRTQIAELDAISGATYTSQAFEDSLADALEQAQTPL